jgi:2'-5' RNA ligase
MRLFTAIDLDDHARAAIAALQDDIRRFVGRSGASLRFVGPEQLHMTLVFIGEVDATRAAHIVELMQPTLPLKKFPLVFGGIGTYPSSGAPRVLWLGALQGGQEAIEVHAAVAERLASAGVTADSRPFRPHLTLARWREGRGARSSASVITREFGRAPGDRVIARVSVQAVTLYESRLSSKGPTYTALAHPLFECR